MSSVIVPILDVKYNEVKTNTDIDIGINFDIYVDIEMTKYNDL